MKILVKIVDHQFESYGFFDLLFAVGFEQEGADESPLTSSAERTTRNRNLTDEQKATVSATQKPSDMEYSETWNNNVDQSAFAYSTQSNSVLIYIPTSRKENDSTLL